MIDSVIFRIPMDKYPSISAQLGIQKKGTIWQTAEQTKESVVHNANLRKYVRYMDTSKMLMITPYTTHSFINKNLPSSHYSIAVQENYNHNYYEFNVSIPKWLWGHNILQFTPGTLNKEFSFQNSFEFMDMVSDVYKMFFHFFDDFFSRSFSIIVDKIDIQLIHIDICYNQYFNSKLDALNYFKYMKEIKKSYIRDGSDYLDRTTSLCYRTSGRFYRIYHKGSEYAANDSKKHFEINRLAKKQIFNVPFLQSHADLINRFEIRFSFDHLSYIFRHWYFRDKCEQHLQNKALYRQLDNLERRGKLMEVDDNKQHLVPKYKRDFYRYFKNLLQITDKVYLANNVRGGFYYSNKLNEKLQYKDLQNYLKKTPHRIIQWDYMTRESKCVPESVHYNRILFSQEIFRDICKELWAFFNEFQLKNVPSVEGYKLLVDDYIAETLLWNKANKYNIEFGYVKARPVPKKNNLIQMISMIQQYSFVQIEKLQIYGSKRNWLRYKKHLKNMGIDKGNSFLGSKIIGSKNYEVYYQYLKRFFKEWF